MRAKRARAKQKTFSGLKALTLVYLASASAFAMVVAFQSDEQWARGVQQVAHVAAPVVDRAVDRTVVALNDAGIFLNDKAVKPSVAWVSKQSRDVMAKLNPPEPSVTAELKRPPVTVAKRTPPLRPSIVERQPPAGETPAPMVLPPEPPTVVASNPPPPATAPVAKPPAAPPAPAPTALAAQTPAAPKPAVAALTTPTPAAPKPAVTAPAERTVVASLPPAPMVLPGQPDADLKPAPDPHPPSPLQVARVLSHLKASLTANLYDNFKLFLYVSKAQRGPWAQRMYVFRKTASGNLNMLYSFPVSTGAEIPKKGPAGDLLETDTPQGYYQLDPERMYRRYHSVQWDQAMPYAMFFNWEHDGVRTGLAIHSATGTDIAELGKRSSAGCVRLDPRNARLLFNLIRKDYKGFAPRFAYDRRTATMSNDGLLMRNKSGNLEYAPGYKVLVFIENNGGQNIVAALF